MQGVWEEFVILPGISSRYFQPGSLRKGGHLTVKWSRLGGGGRLEPFVEGVSISELGGFPKLPDQKQMELCPGESELLPAWPGWPGRGQRAKWVGPATCWRSEGKGQGLKGVAGPEGSGGSGDKS